MALRVIRAGETVPLLEEVPRGSASNCALGGSIQVERWGIQQKTSHSARFFRLVFDIRNSCENIEYETVGAPRRMNFEGFLFVKKGKPKRGFERKMKHIFATRWRERYHFKNKKRGDRG